MKEPNPRSMTCQFCDKVFTKAGTLKVHIRRLHIRERHHKCDMCIKSFITRGDLKSHMIMHTSILPFQCPKCEKSFKRKKTLTDHMARHLGPNLHQCKECGKWFFTRKDVGTHMRQYEKKHQTCKERRNLLGCLKCFKEFTEYGILRHVQAVHNNKEKFF